MEVEIYNPNNEPVENLPTIYGFNNGEGWGGVIGQLLSQDGYGMGSHACSSEFYIPGDLGVLKGWRPDRHEGFRKHYPNGYKMEFVPSEEIKTHKGLQAAFDEAKRVFESKKAEEAPTHD